MAMNVKLVPTLDNEINDIRSATAEIVNESILPVEHALWGWMTGAAKAPSDVVENARTLRREIQEKVKHARLWAPHLPPDFGGMGLSFLQHAYMNEVLAYSRVLLPCSVWWRRTPATRKSCSSTAVPNSTSSGCGRSPRGACSPPFP